MFMTILWYLHWIVAAGLFGILFSIAVLQVIICRSYGVYHSIYDALGENHWFCKYLVFDHHIRSIGEAAFTLFLFTMCWELSLPLVTYAILNDKFSINEKLASIVRMVFKPYSDTTDNEEEEEEEEEDFDDEYEEEDFDDDDDDDVDKRRYRGHHGFQY